MSSEVSEHLKALLYWLLSPEVLSQIGVYIGVGASIVGFGAKVFTRLWNKLEKKQNEEIDGIKNAISALTLSFQEMQQTQERDFLRLQIVTGIQSERLSIAEVLALYDSYTQKGGNSYITRVVNDYIEEKRHKETKNDH
jgi:hypothetical protein|nr:MAG TPA: hypothetical protein [Caudoviricetes sp.]